MTTLTPKHRKKYKKICADMQSLLDDISEYIPDVNIYIEDSGNWNLMNGDSHDDEGSPRRDRVIENCSVFQSSGGGW
jgi:hypothetical protein